MQDIDWLTSSSSFYINPRFPEEQLNNLVETAQQALPDYPGHFFFLTSGTTAKTCEDFKWVVLSKSGFLASAQAVNQHIQSDSKDVWIQSIPTFHVGGMGILARSFLSGAKVIQSGRWEIHSFLNVIDENKATLGALVPTQVYDLVSNEIECPKSIRAIIVGGGALPFYLYKKAFQLGWPLLPSYGMTEASTQIATSSINSIFNDSSEIKGLPKMEILSNWSVTQAEDGLIRIKGPSALSAYVFKINGEIRIVDPKVEGWFSTQDLGKVFGNTIEVLGRKREYIKIGGEGVHVSRLKLILESLKLKSNNLSETVILPVPHERLGYEIHLVAPQNTPIDQITKLREDFNSEVLPFEKIRRIHFIEKIPRTPLGKLLEHECLSLINRLQ